ncbi:MAG TPA: fibronectin type III domain-containing protein [Candidatus Limnocylindria bacterium]|nr:fibronectin type III domain-containing protein [Candidatus Limnocylindria bacterium]
MKKFLSAALCAAFLLGLLPMAGAPARMATVGRIVPEATSAYVGDTLYWTAFGSSQYPGSTGFMQEISHYFNGAPRGGAAIYTPNTAFTAGTLASAPGRYDAILRARDSFSDDSTYSVSVFVTLRPAPRNVKVGAVNGTSLKVTWDAVPGADGYEIWRSEFKAGPYALVRTTTATSWSNTYLTPGKIYWYQVRSTNVLIFSSSSVPSGQFSAPVGSIPLGKAAIQSATATGKDRVKLVITPVPGASGYQILVSPTAGGTYKVLRRVSASTLTITGLTPNTAYYFKVQAYRTVSAGTFFGALSAYRGVRTLK